jgi:hypothetical protein
MPLFRLPPPRRARSLRRVAIPVVVTLVSGLAASPSRAAAGCGTAWGPVSKTVGALPAGASEASGFAASPRHPGWGWMIRDSGHPASLYAVRVDASGNIGAVREVDVPGASNRDWEDLNYSVGPDGRPRLWTVESGQSGGNRYIYEILEPDPATARTATLLHRYAYAYPDIGYANDEASFFYGGQLVLVTKTAPGRVYRFERPLTDKALNRPAFVGTLPQADRISMARLSPDKSVLVTATHTTMGTYRLAGGRSDLAALIGSKPVAVRKVSPNDNVEAGDFIPWARCNFLLLAESKTTYWVRSL